MTALFGEPTQTTVQHVKARNAAYVIYTFGGCRLARVVCAEKFVENRLSFWRANLIVRTKTDVLLLPF